MSRADAKESKGPEKRYRLSGDAYRRWYLEQKIDNSRLFSPDEPTVKAIIYLALHEMMTAGHPATYDDLRRLIQERRLLSEGEEIPADYLRVALSDLRKDLITARHPYHIEDRKVGREKRFRLIKATNQTTAGGEDWRRDGIFISMPTPTPMEIARRFINDRRLSFQDLFVFPTSLYYYWYSLRESERRARHEASAWDLLSENFKSHPERETIALAGLGISQSGLGEIELLGKILEDARGEERAVHYLALDTSDALLASHAIWIRARFGDALESGRLVFAAVRGDVYRLADAIGRARSEFRNRGLEQEFFPEAASHKVVSFFVNCIGNEAGKETSFLSSVRQAFPFEESLTVLLGISVQKPARKKREPEQYPSSWFDFLGQTPRFLTEQVKCLESFDAPGDVRPLLEEFEILGPDGTLRKDYDKVCLAEYHQNQYDENSRLNFDLYRFRYALTRGLRTRDKTAVARKGIKIDLYNILKYDLKSFMMFLEQEGYEPSLVVSEEAGAGAGTDIVRVLTRGEEERYYAVIAARPRTAPREGVRHGRATKGSTRR